MTYALAKHTGFLVVYIEYRLIPEHKFPAAYNDSLSTTLTLVRAHHKYGIDVERLVLMGDSAGGNLASVLAQQMLEHGLARPRLQVLIYPILQFLDFALPSYERYLPASVLGSINRENVIKFLGYLTGEECVDETIFRNGHTSARQKDLLGGYVSRRYLSNEDNQQPQLHGHLNDTENRFARLTELLLSNIASPLLVDDAYLAAHTPERTILITAEMDVLRDEGFIYAERLRRVQKRVTHVHYDDLFHGIFGLVTGPFKFDKAARMVEHIASMIAIHVNELANDSDD